MKNQDQYTPLIAVLLSGAAPSSEATWSTADASRFAEACRSHGVSSLIHDIIARQVGNEAAKADVLAALHEYTVHAAVFETQHARVLADLTKRLSAAGVDCLLFKGSALAYRYYRLPYTRERLDSDLLFPNRQAADRAVEILCTEQGFVKFNTPTGSLTSYEQPIHKRDVLGAHHELDIHWQLNNNNIYGATLNFDELMQRSQTVDIGGATFSIPCTVDALLIACLHRMAAMEDGNENRLIWLYDIKLLGAQLSQEEWATLLDRSTGKGVAHVCQLGLQAAEATFGPIAPDALRTALQDAARNERIPSHLIGSHAGKIIADVTSLSGWGLRARYAQQVFFPPLDYMREKYRFSHTALAPAYYLHRAFNGLWKALTGKL